MDKLLILIPLENVGFNFVQTFSLFVLISLFLFPFLLILFKIKKTNISTVLLMLVAWSIFSTMLNILLRQQVQENLLRPLPGLIIGLSVFFVAREIFYRSDDVKIFKSLYYSLLILFSFFIYDFLFRFNLTFRIYASYTEPSHLGSDIALIYVPILMLYSKYLSQIKKAFVFLLLSSVTILTFSATTYVKILFFFLFFLFLNITRLKLILFYLLCFVSTAYIAYFLFSKYFPDNYFFSMITNVMNNITKGYTYLNVSLTDRFSFWIFLLNLKNIDFDKEILLFLIIGYGLGADTLFLEFLPYEVAEQIIGVKKFSSYITSFLARIFFYNGLIGVILYIISIFFMYKKVKYISFSPKEKKMLFCWLATLVFSSSFDLAPFQTVALWFLPAYIDGVALKLKKNMYKQQ